ncbi:MAG: GGDEF domain-containing protein [Lachnospiraceae bacterium]|nr:GGDEF domain-containing protein [Lachnospiraceae bacterium]
MGNLKHYITEIMNGNSFFSAKFIFRYSLIGVAVLHFLNAALALLAGSYLLSVGAVLMGVFFLSVLLPQLESNHLMTIYLITLIEILLMSLVSTLILGPDSGHRYYLFSCITSTFYFTFLNERKDQTYHSLPLALSMMIIFCFFIIYALSRYIPPMKAPESSFVRETIHAVNSLCAFFAMIIFTYLFVWEIQKKEKALMIQNEKLDELAHRDPLTHLLNRRSMNEILLERMEILKKSGRRFTMVLGDIDDFKKVNDTYGHDAGDLVLVNVANKIVSTVGEMDAVCRWGGEEILILVQDPLEMASVTAEKIRKNIEADTISFEDKQIRITMTFGIAESIPGYRIEHLIQQADDKLYYGKKHGKNMVVTDLKKD